MIQDSMIKQIGGLDPAIHHPARLMIVLLLTRHGSLDYLELMNLTSLTSGNITTHLNKLVSCGYITICKTFKGKKPNTAVSITEKGKKAYQKWGEAILPAIPPKALRVYRPRFKNMMLEHLHSSLANTEWYLDGRQRPNHLS
ncbi:MAG: transcriptional regulator, partial [Candidatus Cloacimonadaceae bacterium]|nr:transcriptional regulator [Candidatus Cloacimonadaceae bacterium]